MFLFPSRYLAVCINCNSGWHVALQHSQTARGVKFMWEPASLTAEISRAIPNNRNLQSCSWRVKEGVCNRVS
eukprot:2757577-Pyramimonas_sp.AAC.1